MNVADNLVLTKRRIIRRLNWFGGFIELGREQLPVAVVAGYTRSGTTFLGRILSNVLGCRPIHEPLNPDKVRETQFFSERESIVRIRTDKRYQDALKSVFSSGFKGSRYTNTGTRIIYNGRLVKIVRGNHYLDYLAELLPGQKFVFIMRNPFACVASRLRLGWSLPDFSHCINDIWPYLSDAQQALYSSADSIAGRLAISWCIDNMLAMRNSDNPEFCFVHYEQIVIQPKTTLQILLDHIGRNYSTAKLEREIRRELSGPNAQARLDNWRLHMSDADYKIIDKVLHVFDMTQFYSVDNSFPKARLPFINVCLS